MRAMILAAGLGTRMHPLSALRAKPALPVRGMPVISHLLFWLEAHGVHEVAINLHHLPETVIEAAESYKPSGTTLQWFREPTLLGTGGGIRRAADFLQQSDPSLVLTGDMLVDMNLQQLVARHRERGDETTLVLRDDARAAEFGTVGIDENDCIRRIGSRRDLGGERRAGIFTGVRLFAARAFESLPPEDRFEDLSDWLVPRLTQGAEEIRGILMNSEECAWEPVGTTEEYLRINLDPPKLSFLTDKDRLARTGTQVHGSVILGSGATLPQDAELQRSIVWEAEEVPSGTRGCDGVFACGTFHPCGQGDHAPADAEEGAEG